MKLIFSVYDSAAKFYSDPFFALTKGQALRDFVRAANDKNTYLNLAPADYTLFQLGSFDELTGKVDMELTPVALGKAIEYLNDSSFALKSEQVVKTEMDSMCESVN